MFSTETTRTTGVGHQGKVFPCGALEAVAKEKAKNHFLQQELSCLIM